MTQKERQKLRAEKNTYKEKVIEAFTRPLHSSSNFDFLGQKIFSRVQISFPQLSLLKGRKFHLLLTFIRLKGAKPRNFGPHLVFCPFRDKNPFSNLKLLWKTPKRMHLLFSRPFPHDGRDISIYSRLTGFDHIQSRNM